MMMKRKGKWTFWNHRQLCIFEGFFSLYDFFMNPSEQNWWQSRSIKLKVERKRNKRKQLNQRCRPGLTESDKATTTTPVRSNEKELIVQEEITSIFVVRWMNEIRMSDQDTRPVYKYLFDLINSQKWYGHGLSS